MACGFVVALGKLRRAHSHRTLTLLKIIFQIGHGASFGGMLDIDRLY